MHVPSIKANRSAYTKQTQTRLLIKEQPVNGPHCWPYRASPNYEQTVPLLGQKVWKLRELGVPNLRTCTKNMVNKKGGVSAHLEHYSKYIITFDVSLVRCHTLKCLRFLKNYKNKNRCSSRALDKIRGSTR